MKTLFKYLCTLAVLLLMVTSCENPLDQQAVDTFNQDVVFSDINVAKAFLGKCYDRMGGNTNNGILGMREDLLSSATDQTLCIHRPAAYVNLKSTQSPDQLGWFANTGYAGFLRYNDIYADIQNVNVVLANIDNVPTTTSTEEALKIRLKGEAYFIRAFLYTNLLMGHGGAVIASEPWLLGQDFLAVKRSTLAQTKDFILADIANAITNLPLTIEQGRANQATAAALKARLLMFCASTLTNGGNPLADPENLVTFPAGSQTALLQNARDAALAVMNGTYGTYSLVGTTADPPSPMTEATVKTYADNYFNIFNQHGKWNSETIWGIQYPLTGGNVSRANIWFGPNGFHNWGNNNPTEPAVRSFEMNDGTPFVWEIGLGSELRTATAAELASNPLLNPYYGREPRFYGIVLYHGAPWQQRPNDAIKYDPLNQVQTGNFYNDDGTVKQYGVDTRNSDIENWNATKTGYYIKKFMDPATVGQFFYNTNTWVEFRYAEILLIYAEACIELAVLGQPADLQNGIDALNMVRNRAGLPDRVTAEPLVARAWLRHEREIEFFAEGHRWFDIRRWMICDQVVQNVYGMKIKQFANGNMEWKLDLTDLEDTRSWGGDKIYWLPIPRDEMTKAGTTFQQNPGY